MMEKEELKRGSLRVKIFSHKMNKFYKETSNSS